MLAETSRRQDPLSQDTLMAMAEASRRQDVLALTTTELKAFKTPLPLSPQDKPCRHDEVGRGTVTLRFPRRPQSAGDLRQSPTVRGRLDIRREGTLAQRTNSYRGQTRTEDKLAQRTNSH